MKKIAVWMAALAFVGIGVGSAHAMQFVTIGTGGVTGVYYPAGGAISKLVNAKRKTYHMRMTVESTGGSVYNVNALRNGDIDMGVVQSDIQYQAYKGLGNWKGKPFTKLRALFSLHPEAVNILAAADKNIHSVADLKGKVVNIGSPGTGQRVNALDLFRAEGINPQTEMTAEGIKPAEAAQMLQDGRIDAYFYTVGHPNGSFKEAVAGTRKVNFVAVDAPTIAKLVKEMPYYAPATIPVADYPGVANKADVHTFGVKATICTTADMPEKEAYEITKTVFENLDKLKKLHPALAVLTKENMLQGLSAPLHPGALKYFKEVGLIK
jgi:TRAP transporter TAXI family solute receptor